MFWAIWNNVETKGPAAFVFLCGLLTLPVLAAPVSWEDLPDPQAQVYEDPYRGLGYSELKSLQEIALLSIKLENASLTEADRQDLENRKAIEQTRLEEAGIDPQWLISQRWVVAERREKAATAGNPDLDGARATISGFVIPAPRDKEGRNVAYLVPERGMCAHIPPPPPNQMIRLVFADNWYPEFLYEPVTVSGKLAIAPSNRRMRVVDGPVNMASTFRLNVDEVGSLVPKSEAGSQDRRWPVKPRALQSGSKED